MATFTKQPESTPPNMGFWQDLAVLLRLRKRDANILVVGLDNSGKSTIINYLKPKQLAASQIVPTVGFRVDKIKSYHSRSVLNSNIQFPSLARLDDRLNLTAFDMAGQSRYRSLWERYYVDCHGVIFVIDSCDSMRMAVAANELHLMIQHPEMMANSIPILILANKCDLPNARTVDQVKMASPSHNFS